MRATRLTALIAAVAAVVIDSRTLVAQGELPCMMCHADVSLFAGTEDPSRLVVAQEEYSNSVHGVLGFSCAMCHQGVIFPHPDDMPTVNCGSCHSAIADIYQRSMHGYALDRGSPNAPACKTCHGTHGILRSADPRAPTHRLNVPATCATCHGTQGLLTDAIVKVARPAVSYAESIHGQRSEEGISAAANCNDCHGVHNLGSPDDPTSSVSHMNVSSTCGKCHQDVQIEYEQSIHGRALRAGVSDSPTCNDCHGEHLILSHNDPDATTYAARLATETCGTCHDDPVIVATYGLRGGEVGSYVDSYHGWASRRGYELAATCVSCHSTHRVLPASDSTSTIYISNVVQTCQQCHPGADQQFAASYTHEATSVISNPINRLIKSVYLWLIALTIGGMLLHNVVILSFYAIKRRKEAMSAESILRLDVVQRIQHVGLLVSFWLLVLTGFALRFPDAWWVKQLSVVGMTEPVRSTLHRIGAVVMVLVSLSHLWYIISVKRGRKEFWAMLPNLQDVKDFWANMKYYTWRSEKKAKFGRYDYTQKAEYWALVWGTVVMALTGFVLWFPTVAVGFLPAIAVTISQTIHYYEAWLATLAIVVWHFFFVFFYPGEYPMNWTWLTGKMSKKTAEEHHGRWYKEEIAHVGEESGASSEA